MQHRRTWNHVPCLALVLALSAAACSKESPTAERAGAVAARAELVRHAVDVGGRTLALYEKRPAEPRAVIVLVHGMTWSSLPDFDLQVDGEVRSFMDGLVDRGIAAYAVDLRGYGGSPRDADGFIDPDEAVADLGAALALVRRREGRSAAVLGWSLGACVAQMAVQRQSSLATHLVLVGWPGPDFPYATMPTSDAPLRAPTTEEMARSDFIAPGAISERAVAAYVGAALEADPTRVDWRGWSTLAAEMRPVGLELPVLVLRGELDPIADPDPEASLRRSTAPQIRSVVVPGCSHAVFLEEPGRAACLDALASFLIEP